MPRRLWLPRNIASLPFTGDPWYYMLHVQGMHKQTHPLRRCASVVSATATLGLTNKDVWGQPNPAGSAEGKKSFCNHVVSRYDNSTGMHNEPTPKTNSLEVDGEVVVGHGLLGRRQALRDRDSLLRQRVVHEVPGGRRPAYCRRRRGRRSSSAGIRAGLHISWLGADSVTGWGERLVTGLVYVRLSG